MSGLVESTAPLRVDLAGGTLDLWPLHLLHEGATTVNVALQLRARVTYCPGGNSWQLRADDLGARRQVGRTRLEAAARRATDGDPFALALQVLRHAGCDVPGTLSTAVDGPPGGGLAGSSALMVALLGMAYRVTGQRLDRHAAPALARDLEARVLGLPTGVQDYYPALFGGGLQLLYAPGVTRCREIRFDVAELEARVVLAYSGKPHSSAPSNWSIYRRRMEGDALARRCFQRIANAGQRAASALERSDWRRLGEAMTEDWAARKEMEPALAPPDLVRLEAAGRGAGARAAKCCGAASGGTMLFLLGDPRRRAEVEEAVRAVGARVVPFAVARRGLSVRRRGELS